MHHWKNLSFLSSFGLRAVFVKRSKIAVFASIVTSKRARWPPLFISFLSSSWLVTSVYQVSYTIYVRFFYWGMTLNRVFNKPAVHFSMWTHLLLVYGNRLKFTNNLTDLCQETRVLPEFWVVSADIVNSFFDHWHSVVKAKYLICSWCNLMCWKLTIKYTVIVHHFLTNYCTVLSLTWFNTNKGNK